MPKNPKQQKEGSVEEDQRDRGYYYDDSHGYEEYKEEENEEPGESDAGESEEVE